MNHAHYFRILYKERSCAQYIQGAPYSTCVHGISRSTLASEMLWDIPKKRHHFVSVGLWWSYLAASPCKAALRLGFPIVIVYLWVSPTRYFLGGHPEQYLRYVIFTYLLFSHKKEWNNAICSNMDGPRHRHTEWSQKERNDITYTSNLKRKTRMNLFTR